MSMMLTVTQNSIAFCVSHSPQLSWPFSQLWVDKNRKENERKKNLKEKINRKSSFNSGTQGLMPRPITLLDLLTHLSYIDKCCRTPAHQAITMSTPQASIGKNYDQPLISVTEALSPHSNATPCRDKILSMPWAAEPLSSIWLTPWRQQIGPSWGPPQRFCPITSWLRQLSVLGVGAWRCLCDWICR